VAYLYRHTRLDTGLPFYIGIGSDEDGHYKRAYNKDSRNKAWKREAKFGYEVEVMFDDIEWEYACKKEIEFIKLYGRQDIGTGILVNMTNGGDGALGHSRKTTLGKIIITKNNKEKRILLEDLKYFENLGWKKGRSKRAKENNSNSKKGSIPWNKGKVGVYSELVLKSMSDRNKGKKHSIETLKKMKNAQIGGKHPRARAVLKFDMQNNFLDQYETITEAQKMNPKSTKILKVCTGKQRQSGGFIWKFKDSE